MEKLFQTTTGRWIAAAILYPLSSILHLLSSTSGHADIPWPDGATAHYRVEVSADRPTNEVSLVCGVRFFSGGLLQPNAQNIRVTDSKGTALPIEIVHTHPLNASLVLFPLQPGEETYRLFFGGAVTSGAALTRFQRGLFYETRQRPDGDSSTLDSIRKLWSAAAANSFGVATLDDLQTRCNPFDETDNQFASRTWGAWQTPREDVYKLGIFAKDHGFFSVNGVPVASTTLDHATKTTPIADALLPGGVQTVEILQARVSGTGVTGISWLTPWPDYYYANLSAKPITAAWHPPIVQGLARDFTVRGQAFWACFNDFQSDVLLGAEQPVVLVRFHNRTAGKTDGVTYQWDFGDGTTSTEPNPLHLYVKPGRYVVTLTAGGTSKFQKTVLASSFSAIPAQKVAANSSVNPFAAQETLRLAGPMLDRFEPGTLWTLIAIAEQITDPKLRAETILRLGALYLSKSGASIPTTVEIPVRHKLAEARTNLGQFDAAVAELQQMDAKLGQQRAQRTRLRLEIGKLQQRAGKFAAAMEGFQQLVKDKGGDDPRMERAAHIAMGETYLQQGDLANARRAFEQAAQVEVGDGRTEREQAIRRGSLYSTLRQAVGDHAKLALEPSYGSELISRDALLTLLERARNSFDSLASEFPDARLNPDVIYLNASLLLAEGSTDGCLTELKTLAKAETTGRYALRSTLLESRAAFVSKDYDKASSLVEAVLQTTKEEDIVREATKLQLLIKDAIQSRTQFTDAPKRYWPNPLPADPSFEKTQVESNVVANLEFSTPAEPAKAKDVMFSVVEGFGTDGKRCVLIELPQPVTPPVYVVVRFPTAIGDRVFARCNVLSNEVDFRWSELRRSTTQGEGLYGSINSTFLSLQQWGWLHNAVNVEPWRSFAWRSGPATAGGPQGYMMFVGIAKEGRKIIPAGTRIYVDAAEAFLAP